MADSIERQIYVLTQRLKKVAEKDVPLAASSALNKAAKRIDTRVVRGVAKSENIPNKLVRKKVFIRRSRPATQKARVRIYRTDISVISLISKGTVEAKMGTGTSKAGVTARGRRYPGAFINRQSGRSPQVFKRDSSTRYPIRAIKIPIRKTVERITPVVAGRVMRNNYPEIYRQELNFRLSKRLGRI